MGELRRLIKIDSEGKPLAVIETNDDTLQLDGEFVPYVEQDIPKDFEDEFYNYRVSKGKTRPGFVKKEKLQRERNPKD